MSLFISLVALIIAIGAFIGCVQKTMHLQSQIGELLERIVDLEHQKVSRFGPDFFKKGEDVVMHGSPPGSIETHRGKEGRLYRTFPGKVTADELSDYSTGNEPRGIIFKAERPIVVQDNPNISGIETKTPPPPPLKKRVTEKSTTTETRNDTSAPPKKTVSKKPIPPTLEPKNTIDEY